MVTVAPVSAKRSSITGPDAPDEPVVIDLQAVVNAPALDARPAEVSFPTTPVGCSSVESVVLENHTEVDATVASLHEVAVAAAVAHVDSLHHARCTDATPVLHLVQLRHDGR